MAAQSATPLLKVEGLKQYFKVNKNFTVKAVDDVSFEIYPGETYGLVGESGSGKSTIGRSVIRLYDPTAGKITFDGHDISGRLSRVQNDTLRTQMQMIFQDPMASLNPRKKVEDIIGEGLDIHHMYKTREERREKVEKILEKVGLAPEHAERYPHQFSGGQRQRIGIARAIALDPALIVCDEPVSALDVSIQAQVVNMFEDLQKELGLTYLFIAHDLSVVRHISNRIGVMYLGTVVELAPAQEIFDNPKHPYTEALMQAIPTTDLDTSREMKILEERFRTRLEWGISADIQPPDFETRVAIVKRKAELLNLDLPNDVAEYIANHLKQNIRQLEGAVKKLNAYYMLEGIEPCIGVTTTAIKDTLNDSQPIPVTIEKILNEVARTYNVMPADIRGKKRNANVSAARQMTMYIIREVTGMSMEAIGQEFQRDHSTVVYSIKTMEENINRDQHLKEMCSDIMKNVRT